MNHTWPPEHVKVLKFEQEKCLPLVGTLSHRPISFRASIQHKQNTTCNIYKDCEFNSHGKDYLFIINAGLFFQ